MSKPKSVEEILVQAKKQEMEYEWLATTELYEKALELLSEQSFLKKGEIYEQLSHACFRAAFQGESVHEFAERMCQAAATYEKAKESYAYDVESRRTPRALRCEAMIAYANYWRASEVHDKMRFLDDCWRLTKESLKAFLEAGDNLSYGKTFNQLCTSAGLEGYFDLDWQRAR